MKRLILTTLSIALATTTWSFSAIARPLSNQRLMAPESNITYLSRSQFQAKLKTVKIRNRLATPPTNPQPYWKVYWSTDKRFALVCWVNDDSGQIEFCDVYA